MRCERKKENGKKSVKKESSKENDFVELFQDVVETHLIECEPMVLEQRPKNEG